MQGRTTFQPGDCWSCSPGAADDSLTAAINYTRLALGIIFGYHACMIILAVGMPRAGSGWHYNLTHDLALAAGAVDARQVRERYHLEGILTEVNCNIGVLSPLRLAKVLLPAGLRTTFTIKLHAGPTSAGRLLIRTGLIKPTYIYRDPRDALISAYEYGERARKSGRSNAFSGLTTIEHAIDFMAEYVDYWAAWTAVPHCHTLKYEDLKGNYDAEADRLARFLGLDSGKPDVQTVIEKYRPEQARQGDQGLHFVKGISGRYRNVLTPAQQQLCLDRFGPGLEKMGYSLD